jgi:hypothetical protein
VEGSYPKCRLAKARPDPDFRYFSNLAAQPSFWNSNVTTIIQGAYFALWVDRPALCHANLVLTFELTPT